MRVRSAAAEPLCPDLRLRAAQAQPCSKRHGRNFSCGMSLLPGSFSHTLVCCIQACKVCKQSRCLPQRMQTVGLSHSLCIGRGTHLWLPAASAAGFVGTALLLVFSSCPVTLTPALLL